MILNCYKYPKINNYIVHDTFISVKDIINVSYWVYIKINSDLRKKEINIKINDAQQSMCYYKFLQSHSIVWC